MQDVLNHPVIQGGVAPFLAALIVVAMFRFVRLGGLAVVAGFATAVFLVSGFDFSPLTATRKIVLLGLVAPLVGMLIDFAFKPTRIGSVLIVFAGGAAAAWAFWSILVQKELPDALMVGGLAAAFVAAATAIGLMLAAEPVRAGSAALTLGLSAGICAVLGASALFGMYGIALGAGAGAFLLLQMVTGKRIFAGMTFLLPATLLSGLLGAGTMVLAKLPWYALPALLLVPLATLVPLPEKMPIWQQAVLRSVCAMLVAGVAFALTWRFAGKGIN